MYKCQRHYISIIQIIQNSLVDQEAQGVLCLPADKDIFLIE